MNPGTEAGRGNGGHPDAGGPAACPACLADGCTVETNGGDRLFRLAPGRYPLFRCRRCRCLFQHPMPAQEALAEFYPEGYWRFAGPSSSRAAGRLLERAEQAWREFANQGHVRFLRRSARRRPAAGRSLLDVGCGSGLFLYLAGRAGFEAHGMDVSARAVRAARAQYGLDVRPGEVGSGQWNGRRFDYVTMFHVLEHLRDPAGALAWVGGLLNPGGRVIIQVPNADSLQARVFGRSWYGLDVPRHVVNFTPGALHRLLARCGYRVCSRARFSLRDNPASIASSIAPLLDPVGLHGRRRITSAPLRALMEGAYLGLFLLALPFALLESAVGRGGTLWVEAEQAGG